MPELTAQPLSPELILVSPPDVAALAREQLPEPPETLSNGHRSEAQGEPASTETSEASWNDFLADVRSRPVEPVVDPRPIPRPPVRIRRDGRTRLLVGMVALAGVAAVVGLAWARDHGNQRPQGRGAAPKPAKPSSHAKTPPAPAARKPKPKPKQSPKPPPSKAAGFVPTRIWSWAAAPGAATYVVRFLRDGHTVLKVRTGSPRLRLPPGFTFRPGSYRWTVTAFPSKGKGAHVVVDSGFTVG